MHHDDQDILREDRLLVMLERLLGLRPSDFRATFTEAASIIAETFGADKVDIFVYESDRNRLVALGTSRTRMGERQQALGLDVLPLANGGRAAWVFETGTPHMTGRADEDPEELRAVVEGLGVRSMVNLPLEIDGQRRGVLQIDSATPDYFSERDVRALQAVAGWVELIIHRSEMAEEREREAERRGGRRAANELAKITRRQQEVAACVAEGLTNEEIAQRLVLTPGTVANHIEGILRRLGLRSRTQVGVWAVERGIYRSDWGEPADESPDRAEWRGRSISGRPDADPPNDRSTTGDDGPEA
jgi:DNA-binding CsgD family transcriptional regulator